MTITEQQLTGNWISECTHPQHLLQDGCTIKFFFDELPFDNYSIVRITATADKKETTLYTGPYTIQESVNDEFFIVINDTDRIPARQFTENNFIADVPEY